MTDVTFLSGNGANKQASAIQQARAEVAAEIQKKGVEKLKVKLRERAAAATVLANVDREIADLEAAIEQGNV